MFFRRKICVGQSHFTKFSFCGKCPHTRSYIFGSNQLCLELAAFKIRSIEQNSSETFFTAETSFRLLLATSGMPGKTV
jgi:hypothetical protein